MKPSTILKKARKLIEKGWTRGVLARDAHGNAVDENDRRAARWCAIGAILKAGGKSSAPAYDFMNEATGNFGVAVFNNAQSNKLTVLAAFDRAIKLAQSEGQ